MALLFMDGFDHYSSAQIDRKWTSTSVPTIEPAKGRFGGGALEANISALKSTPNTATLIVGFAAIRELAGITQTLVRFLDTGTEQVDLHWRADNSLEIFGGGASRATTGVILTTGTYHTFELLVTIDNAAGVLTLNVDGVEVIAETSIDTQVSANAFANQVELRGGADLFYDDIRILDTTGSAPLNAFIGDQRIVTSYPDAEGNYVEFDTTFPASPTTHWDKTEETPADDDTSYNESATLTDRDSATMDDLPSLPGGGTVLAVQHVYTAKKDDAGAKSMSGFLRIGGSDYSGATNVLTTSYLAYTDIEPVDPDTAVAWIVAGVDGTEAGYEVEA